ncbi:hypothetical protein, partial [Escherichia coli]|uniref:hypothetical protein n=1 Tax=Escherichia coli TaxID=562 RepID=UPI003CEEC96D
HKGTADNYSRYNVHEGAYQEVKVKGASLVAQLVKNPPAMPEIQVPSLGREDPLEKEMATHSSILAWRIPWTEQPCKLQFLGTTQLND